MLNVFLNELEKRPPVTGLFSRFKDLFQIDSEKHAKFTDAAFTALLDFLEKGEASYQNLAVQAGARWAASNQKVRLRNAIYKRGFLTPSCLWAYRQLRGSQDELFRDFPSPEMRFMQVLLLKEAAPVLAIPFLIENFLTRKDAPEELRTASRLCLLAILETGVAPEQIKELRGRYPGLEILNQWQPGIPARPPDWSRAPDSDLVDFYQLVRSLSDIKELSSLTRTVYLLSLFYVPLTDREWRSLLLSRTDQVFFQRLRFAGIVESHNGGYLLSSDTSRQNTVIKFLYESYPAARETTLRNKEDRLREDRERRARSCELDRQALEMVPEGIICVDRTGLLYYMNPAAESILKANKELRERLFGDGSLEEGLKRYSRERVLSRITASMRDDGESTEIFGNRVALDSGGKRFEVELGTQIVLLRDTTDQHLINKEVGSLYRHELKASLDVMSVGLEAASEAVKGGRIEDGLDFLEEVENKRTELISMLEERIDFIRLHSDAFRIRPATVNLNLVVDHCVNNYREAAAGKGVAIRSDHLHSPAVYVRGEERFLVRALDNIIRNAVRFSETGSEIKVSIGVDGFEGFVKVQDNGAGISPENLGRIFQLGFTTGGTGRGLYLAKRIAVAHSGRIEVKSKLGSGSCFTLRLPLLTES